MLCIDEVIARIAYLHLKINAKSYTHRAKQFERSTSSIWNIFHEIVDDKGDEVKHFYYCTKCDEIEYITRFGGSATQLLRHSCVVEFHNKLNTKLDDVSRMKVKKAAAKFVCMDLRPIYAVECDGLQELFKAGIEMGQKHPKMSMENVMKHFPSRKSVKTMIEAEACDAKEKIEIIFKEALADGGFGCTLDLWSDRYKHNSYLCMTANVYTSTDECIEQKRIVFATLKV